MLISLSWIRDFVDLPADLSAADLAEAFTLTCAEVDGVEHVDVSAKGLCSARVEAVEQIESDRSLRAVTLDVGSGQPVHSVTSALNLKSGDHVLFAPTGSSVNSLGTIADSVVAGRASCGLIVPGDAVGIALAVREAVFLQGRVAPGTAFPAELFNDWVLEIDNKSINHRPDLWGHYGIARELAAMYGQALKPYPVVPAGELDDSSLPEIPIEIDDGDACPRYSGLLMRGVTAQPGPLWMQLRLGHVGLRPIDCLVDLTNYIMLELGQPMHAFDGDKVDRIEVGWAEPGSRFTTLDGVERTMPDRALMIQSGRKSIALAGIMGGAETEISASTETVLLESANFDAHTIRRCASRLGHRTDASARFEKSLDPVNTVLGIRRFVRLARDEFESLTPASRLSDACPKQAEKVTVTVDPEFASRFMGHPVTRDDIRRILTALEFGVRDDGPQMLVDVPSFRATRDISIEADVIEEVARYVGFNNIDPSFPEVTVRSLTPNSLQRLEKDTLRVFTEALGMVEIHDYIWYDATWCERLGYEPGECLTLRNPIAAGLERLRTSLMPGMLQSVERNRRHFPVLSLVELGSAHPLIDATHVERRRVAVVRAERRKNADDALIARLKGTIETWGHQVIQRAVSFPEAPANSRAPWEHASKTATIRVRELEIGRISGVPFELRRRIDEHLGSWSVAWAEFDLDALADLESRFEPLSGIPAFPDVEIDFSVVVEASSRYTEVVRRLRRFDDALLRRLSFVDSYEGKSVGKGKRALTLRATIGDNSRTLVDTDVSRFRDAFAAYLAENEMALRQG